MPVRKLKKRLTFYFDETEEGLVTVSKDKATLIKKVKVFTDDSYESEYFVVDKKVKKEVALPENVEDFVVNSINLPEDIASQLPIIPDGVKVIELSEELQLRLFGDMGDEFEFGGEEDD